MWTRAERSSSRRRLSALRPLPWRLWLPAATLGLLLGEVVAQSRDPAAWRLLLAAALAAPAVARRHRAAGTAALLAGGAAIVGLGLGAFVGAGRGDHLPPTAQASLAERVEGVIEARVERSDLPGQRGLVLVLGLERVTPAVLRAGDRLRVTVWRASQPWEIGERIGFAARLRRPRGFCNRGADRYAWALGRAGIVAVASLSDDRNVERLPGVAGGPRLLLARARAAVAAAIGRALPQAEAGILRALVMGDQSRIPRDLRRAYARTGTAHVLSVSGLHIAIVAGCAFAVLRRVVAHLPWLALRIAPVRLAAVAAILPAAAYALFAGAAAPTVRSLIMGALFFLATALARPPDLEVALAAAALAICLTDPGAPFDASFQLSFAAVLAIVSGLRRLDASQLGAWLRPAPGAGRASRARALLLAGVATSAVAALGTAPLTAAHFGSVSLIGVLANLVVVPLVGWVALLGGLAGTALLAVSGAGAGLCFGLAGWAIAAADRVAEVLAYVPGAAVSVAAPSPVEAAAWGALLWGLTARSPRRRLMIAGLAMAVALAWGSVWVKRHGSGLRVAFLDVGQGDAAVLRLPEQGPVLVVDGGGLPGGLDLGEVVLGPALRGIGRRSVQAIVMSHPQFDHYGGLAAVAADFSPLEFWSTGRAGTSRAFERLERLLDAAGVHRRALSAGHAEGGWSSPAIEVLHPPPARGDLAGNDASLVIAVRYGAERVLLTGDVEARGERVLLGSGSDLGATVLKVPHHGSRSSSSEALVRAARPGLAVAGLGLGNRFGFPAAEVADRYLGHGAAWRGTDRFGEVVIESDGQLARVETCRRGEP